MPLIQKVEDAFESLLTAAAISGLNIYKGLDGAERELPSATISASIANEELGTGCYFVDVSVMIESDADAATPEAAHNTRAEAVRDVVLVDNLASQLSAAVSDFYAYHPAIEQQVAYEPVGRRFQTAYGWRILCCEDDLA